MSPERFYGNGRDKFRPYCERHHAAASNAAPPHKSGIATRLAMIVGRLWLSVAHMMFQASMIAERGGHTLRARTLAENAKVLYEQHGDRVNLGRMLNNLGGLNYLLGKSGDAVTHLKQAFAIQHRGQREQPKTTTSPTKKFAA